MIEHNAIETVPVPTAKPAADAPRHERLQARAEEIAQPKPRSERSAAENYAEWQAINARLLAGDPVTDADAKWHQRYQATAQYRAEAKKKAAA